MAWGSSAARLWVVMMTEIEGAGAVSPAGGGG